MDDRTLLKIALIGAVFGVVGLFVLSIYTDTDTGVIAQIEQLPEGKEVDVIGVVMRVADHGNVFFLTIGEQKIEDVQVVLFKSGNISIAPGDIVRVVGSIDEFQGEKQIIGNRVERK
ncbi:MAG TPA: OB-fold nucleic acid binding domain-containing protein [Candidatus Nanoarchaeia archaeon]|nr:OB-fold nucleic acid binding domain-containing protein [Candidatus Nanoarchaeia archaeon]